MTKYLYLIWLGLASSAYAQEESFIDYQGLRAQGNEAFMAQNTAQTLVSYQNLSELVPDDPEVWYRLSLAYEWNNAFEAAIDAGETAFDLGYQNPASMAYRLAQLSGLNGQNRNALRWLEVALDERFDNRPGISEDPAFSQLLDNPDFQRLSGHLINPTTLSRLEGLQYDLNYFVEEAQRMHAAPDRPAFSEAFSDAVSDLRNRLDDLSDQEVYLEFMQLTAILNDGHTAIYTPDPDSPLAVELQALPLKFFWFEEGLYIVDGLDGYENLAGSEVLRLGDLSSEEVLERLSVFRGVDNAMTWRWMGPQFYLNRLELLNSIGATDSLTSVNLSLRTSAGDMQEVRVEGGAYVIPRKLRPSPAIQGDIPFYLSQVDNNYWLQTLNDSAALYFQFNQVRNDENLSLAEFSEQLAERLVQDEINYLIVDVRHNNGGNNSLVRPLLQEMIKFEQSGENKIYVITGRNTFSAAQNFINQIERWTDAVFVGEPSASSPNFTGEETSLLLPYSKIRGSISTQYWQDSNPGDERAWINPDIPVEVSAEDYFSGRDAALEAVLRAIRTSQD